MRFSVNSRLLSLNLWEIKYYRQIYICTVWKRKRACCVAKAKVGKWARVMRQRRQWAYNRIVSLNFINIIHVFVRAWRSGVNVWENYVRNALGLIASREGVVFAVLVISMGRWIGLLKIEVRELKNVKILL